MSTTAQISRGSFFLVQNSLPVGWVFAWDNPLEELWVLIHSVYIWPSATNPQVITEFNYLGPPPADSSCATIDAYLQLQTPPAPPTADLYFQRHIPIVGGLGNCQ